MPTAPSLSLFLEQGIKPLALTHQLTLPRCFISYAWGAAGPTQDALHAWLENLHNDLSTLGCQVKLDIKTMQETVATYMAEEVKHASVIFIVCTPALKARASEGKAGELSAQALDQLQEEQLDAYGFNNLQKELWHIRQRYQQKKARVFLLLREGDFNTAIPKNFLSLSDFLVRDMREGTDYTDRLVGLSNPLGLVPSMLGIADNPSLPLYQAYAHRLRCFAAPDSDVLTRSALQLQAQSQRFAQEIELDQLQHFYVPLDAQISAGPGGQRHELAEKIQDFLHAPAHKKQKVCLLLGHAGAGKTTYGWLLYQQLWQAYVPYHEEPVLAVRIDLKQFSCEQAKQSVETVLKRDYDLNEEEIKTLKRSNAHFVFIFDGYDELAGGGFFNPYQDNHLAGWGQSVKVIIGCRIEYVTGHDYRTLLGPGGEHNRLQISEWYVSALSADQINDYLVKSDRQGRLAAPLADYQAFLKDTPGLNELIETPFILNVLISAYPALLAKVGALSRPLTRSDLYEAFMEAWFSKEKQKLIESVGSQIAQHHLEKSFLRFSRELAFAMYHAQVNVVTYHDRSEQLWGSESDSESEAAGSSSPWAKFFTDKDARIRHARRGCPLRCVGGNTYGFLHQSFLEYFVADELWRVLLKINPAQPKTIDTALNRWGARYLTHPEMPVVIDFIAKRLQAIEPSLRGGAISEKLYALVATSKRALTRRLSPEHLQTRRHAASNAITILNMAGKSFALKALDHADFFTHIQIPYAWLQTAELSGVDMQGSDVSHSILIGAKLTGANFGDADMTGVRLNQYPTFKVNEMITAMALSADGQQLAVGQWDDITLYRREGRDWVVSAVLTGHTELVTSVAFSPAGNQVVSGSRDKTLRLWGVDGTAGAVLAGHTDRVTSVAFSPSGKQVVSGSYDGTLRLWGVDGTAGVVLAGHENHVTSVAFSPSGDQVVSGSTDKTLRLWGVDGTAGPVLTGHTESVTSVAFSPAGDQVVSGSFDKTLRLWGVDGTAGPMLAGHTDCWVWSVAFSPAGDQVVSGSWDKTLRLWGVDGTAGPVLTGHTGGVTSVAFSPSGKQVVSGSDDKTLRLWGVDGSTVGAVLAGHTEMVTSVAFSPSGKQVVSGSYDGTLRLWGVDGTAGPVLTEHTGAVTSVAFSPAGDQLVSGSGDGTLRLWQRNRKGAWYQLWQLPRNTMLHANDTQFQGVSGLSADNAKVFEELGANVSARAAPPANTLNTQTQGLFARSQLVPVDEVLPPRNRKGRCALM